MEITSSSIFNLTKNYESQSKSKELEQQASYFSKYMADQKEVSPSGILNKEQLSRKVQEDKRLKDACTQWESLLIKMMYTSMKKTVDKSGLIDGGQAEKIFDDMLTDKYAENFANTKSLGLAEILYKDVTSPKYTPPAL